MRESEEINPITGLAFPILGEGYDIAKHLHRVLPYGQFAKYVCINHAQQSIDIDTTSMPPSILQFIVDRMPACCANQVDDQLTRIIQ